MQDAYKFTILTQRWKRKLDAWAQDKRGATAVEFAMIAAPFFFLIFGLLEISMLFIVTTVLEHGLSEASRDIRTGSFQQQGFNEAQFRDSLCSELFTLLDCDDKLSLDVKTFSSFAGSNDDSPIDDDGMLQPGGFQFNPGSANDIVLVRAFYRWELFTPVISAPLSNLANGDHLIHVAIAFRNEPFVSGSGSSGTGGTS